MPKTAGGSATRWGPLFGARAATWAETWEGPAGWGTPVYEHVLDRAAIGPGMQVVCGCGAGRFTRLAADRGANVAGIDASEQLLEPTQLATNHSGESAVAEAVGAALQPLTDSGGGVVLPAWYRAVLARG